MKLSEYLGDQSGKILLHIGSAAALALFLLLTGTRAGIVLVVCMAWGCGLCLVLLTAFVREKNRVQMMRETFTRLDKKYLFFECLDKPKKSYEKALFSIMKRAGKSMIEEVSGAQKKRRQYKDYIEDWVHEIKVPITTGQLLCENHRTAFSDKMKLQFCTIEEDVERVLYYARMENVEKDFIVRPTDLHAVVSETIKKYRTLFIANQVAIETDNLRQMVYADAKWLDFMIGQVLSNAVRYRRASPRIRISARPVQNRSVRLSIRDNGIGIRAEDMPRICERGFTGTNGRIRGGATGMGLYICRRLSEAMEIRMEVASEEDIYTEVSFTFMSKAAAGDKGDAS